MGSFPHLDLRIFILKIAVHTIPSQIVVYVCTESVIKAQTGRPLWHLVYPKGKLCDNLMSQGTGVLPYRNVVFDSILHQT